MIQRVILRCWYRFMEELHADAKLFDAAHYYLRKGEKYGK